jgi:MMPL family
VLPEGTGTDVAAARLVDAVRALPAPFPFQVTGDAAELVDYQATIAERLPLAAGLVALATFVLLFLFTGSVVVPVKAIVMNVLSLGASFGALVWVFQEATWPGCWAPRAPGPSTPPSRSSPSPSPGTGGRRPRCAGSTGGSGWRSGRRSAPALRPSRGRRAGAGR